MDHFATHFVPEDQLQDTRPLSDLKKEMDLFVNKKRSVINKRNKSEFTDKEKEHSSSKTAIRKIDRSSQLKTVVVENWDGPRKSVSDQSPGLEHLADRSEQDLLLGAAKRLAVIEEHLKIKANAKDILSRIKRVEDRILEIEQKYPYLALYNFNYKR